jgi:hypothetical protein
MEESLLR